MTNAARLQYIHAHDADFRKGFVHLIRLDRFNRSAYIHSLGNPPKDGMFVI